MGDISYLLVDDDDFSKSVARELSGRELTAMSSLTEACDLLESDDHSIVIVDALRPEEDDIRSLEVFWREQEQTGKRIYLLTNYPDARSLSNLPPTVEVRGKLDMHSDSGSDWLRSGSASVASSLRNIRDGSVDTSNASEIFRLPGIVDVDGKPIRSSELRSHPISIDVTAVTDELLRQSRIAPEVMRELSPRKFEELVAEIISRLGYNVALTPPTKDGGFDIRVASKEGLGSFVYLVECKRYIPPNKVGVEVVRSLHGVVGKEGATAGVVVTSSYFTSDAEEFQRAVAHQMSLRDFEAVRAWLNNVHALK